MKWVGAGSPREAPALSDPIQPPTSDPGRYPGGLLTRSRSQAPPPSAAHSPDATAPGLPSSPQLRVSRRFRS
ncbi:hypothetical protein Celaphus_00001545 [Cervus elaphus hippelaphus]|uniref:Uncharacterized protein n=1 Tax=Cervus elaphus hippelaphus TaxID=46360 RepID=A0A212DAQ4_CEREH|nr:hypothetical protein Celaphus_00001545 [Cervus elaphus hippelaphus]